MFRKSHSFMLSAVLLVGLVWSLALVLLLSQQRATPEVLAMPVAVASDIPPTAVAVLNTPLPVESPVALEVEPPPPAAPQTKPVSLEPPVVNPTPVTPVVSQNPLPSPNLAAIPLPEEPVANQLMVQFAPDTTAEQQAAYIQSVGGEISQNIDALNAVVIRFPSSMQVLPASPLLKASEPDYYAVAQVDPTNDLFFADQWGLPVIHAPEGWAMLPTDTPEVIVAVLDSGICADNVDLFGRITSGWDFVQDDAVPQDEFGHGCGVAGVIAANGNNAAGIAGVAPNVKIMPIRVLDAQGIGTYSRVAAGITYAVDHGAAIINLSLGGAATSSILQAAIDYAVAHGVMVIAAAGNTGSQTILFPASYAPVIAVGSVDRDLQPSAFSSSGAGIDLYAPGQEIVSTSLDGFASLSGTSLAAPHVAGVAALDMALGQTLKVDGGIVTVSGFEAASPTPTAPPTNPTAVCNEALADEASAALSAAIQQRTLGTATDADVQEAGLAYLDAAHGCFELAYQDGFSIDGGGVNLDGEITDQFVFNNTKWGAASTGVAGNPPGVPGGTVTYSFMPDGVDLSPGLPYEEGAVRQGDLVEALTSLPGNQGTCNLEARVEEVFAIWSAIANIDFVRVTDNGEPFNSVDGDVGDIRIGGHGIDGVGEQLAHAYFPPSAQDAQSGSGDLHFDAAENWGCASGVDAEGRQVIDIGLVALHEVGHAIGLNHVQISAALAIMNPTYNPDLVGENGLSLQPDDITGAKAIYGVRGFGNPAGLAPVNITQDNTPTFTWTAVAPATQYQLQLGIETTYQNPLLDQIITQGSGGSVPAEFTLITPLVNGEYVWRVRAFNESAGGWGAWSENTAFTMRIGVPALLSPLNGETVDDGQVTFQWTTVFGDDPRFDWQLAKLPDFASINLLKSVTNLAQPVYSMNLTQDGTYYWRARANGGDWSTVRSFAIATNAPVPLSPTGGIVLENNMVTFDWTAVPGATEYQYQIDTSPNFVGLLYLDNLFLNKLFLNKLFLNKLFLNKLSEDPLFLNKLFGDDLFLNKLFSDPLFLNKLFLNKLLLDKLFLNKLFLNKLELNKPLSEGIHYWRVRALLADGTWGEWSAPATFIVDTPRSNVVINEVQTGDPSWVELYNSGITPVDLSTWQFVFYLPDGEATFAYTFPEGFVIQAGAYVVLHEANGTNTATDLYMGPNTIDWVIPDVGPLSAESTAAPLSNVELKSEAALSDSALQPEIGTEPTEEAAVVDTAAQSASPSTNTASQPTTTTPPVSAQSVGSADEDTITAQSTFTINIGDTVTNLSPGGGSGVIETAAGNDVYNFTATAGQIAYFDALSGSGMTWRLVNPSGTQVFNANIASDGGRQVLVAGTYALTVTANAGITGNYSFAVRIVTDQTFPIAVGDTVTTTFPGGGSGNIESMGNQDRYTFSGTAGQILYFDSLSSTNSSITWELLNPSNGTVFATSSINDIGRQVLPTTGTYTIRFYSSGITTGTYSFTIRTVAAPQNFSINVGDTVENGIPSVGAGNIENIGSQDVYTFTGTAGQIVFFDGISATDSFYWTLTSPTNTTLFDRASLGSSSSGNGGRRVLPSSGTYTLMVAAYDFTYDDTGTYSFAIRTVAAPQNFSINVGDTVENGVPSVGAGNIENMGSQDIYTFTGTAGQIVFFDGISATDDLYWSLTSPTNTTIFSNTYLGSGSSGNGGRRVLPSSGTYTITVGAYSVIYDDAGTYSFKLWTVAAPQTFPINVGDTVENGVPSAGAGNIESPGSQDIYTFTGTAGQIVFFDGISTTDSFYWTLTSPTNTTLFSTTYLLNDGGRQVLPSSGTYTLTVAAYSATYDDTGTYSFKLWNVAPPQTFPINVGDTVENGVPSAGAGNIESPGAQDIYTFEGTAGQIVYFDAISTTYYSLYWTLTSPTNTTLFSTYIGSDVGRQVLPSSGTYTLTFAAYDNTYDDTGTYSFKLWNVAAPQTFPINVGDTVENGVPSAGAGNIETPGAQDIYTFEGTAGQIVFFDGLGTTDSLYWTLTSPTNTTIFSNTYLGSDPGRRVLPSSGTYTITVGASSATYDDTGTYSFKLWNVAAPQAFNIAVGDLVSENVPGTGAGNLETPGAQDIYTFTATAGQRVFFDGLANNTNSQPYWTLTSPSNSTLFNTSLYSYSNQLLTLAETGTYTLTVSDLNNYGVTGTYSFKLWAVPAPQTFNIGIGDTVSNGVPGAGAGNIETPQAQDVYTFTGTAGQSMFFDGIGNSANSQLYWSLTSPSSVTLFNTYIDYNGGQLTLSETGTYTITVKPNSTSYDFTGTYSFKLWAVPAPQTFSIAIGDIVSNGIPGAGAGNLESPGAQDIYTFAGTAGQTLFFDGINNRANTLIYWNLTSPSNVSRFTTPVVSDGGQITLTETGTYTIKVYDANATSYSSSGATGQYSFRVSLSSSTEFGLALGSSVSNGSPAAGAGNISITGNVDTYVFSAQAGQGVNLVVQSGTSSNLSWRLNAPGGAQIFDTGYTSQNNVSLPTTGIYTLTVQASTSNPNFTGTYGFQLVPIVAAQPFAISIGTTISNGIPTAGAGNLEAYGSQDVYTFTGTAGQNVFFEFMGFNSSFGYWKLTSPSNATLFDRSFSSGSVRQTLPTSGTYTLTVYDVSNSAGTYAFKLWDVSAQTYPISIGTSVSYDIPSVGAGNLSSASEQDVYTFSATAGQTIFFDGIESSQSSLYWRLSSPTSTTLFDQSITSGDKWHVVAQSGTYTLTVYTFNGITGNYSFKLWDAAAQQAFAINYGDTISNGQPGAGAGNIEAPGSQDVYTFTGTTGDVVHFNSLGSTNSSLRWQLTSPTNVQIFDDYIYNDAGRLKLTQTGTYTIRVYVNSSTTGTYSFKTHLIAAPQTFAINIGDTISDGVPSAGAGNIESSGSEDVYTFTATTGQRLYFEGIGGNNYYLTWELHSPTDAVIFKQTGSNNYGPYTINATGTYSLYIYGGEGESWTYGFKIWEVQPPQNFEINVGDVVSKDVPAVGAGNIEAPGSVDIYTFTLASQQSVYFDAIAPLNYSLNWRLTNAFNITTFSTSMNSDAGQYTLSAGTYTLTVTGNSNYRGTYSFRLAENGSDFAITIGDTVSNGVPSTGAGNIDGVGNNDVYVFAGVKGQYVTFDTQTGSSSNLRWQLLGPGSSTPLFDAAFSDRAGVLLTSTGTYRLTVQASSTTPNFTGTYSFALVENTVPASYAIIIGNTVAQDSPAIGAGIIEKAGNSDLYTLNVTATDVVDFDVLTGNSAQLVWRLLDPDGIEVFNTYYTDNTSVSLTKLGTYNLRVQASAGNESFSGAYSFSVIEDVGFSISIGDTVSNGVPEVGAGNIESAGNRDTYTFEATAGQILYFESLDYSEGLLDWELRSPTNVSLFGTTIANDGGRVVIPTTGTYTINVFDYPNGPLTGTYSFIIRAVTDHTFPVNVGDTVSNGIPGVGAGNIESLGHRDHYTFTGTAGQILYFESLGYSQGLLDWELRSPTNESLFGTTIANNGGRVVIPTTGTYTINVFDFPNGLLTGTYSFKVWASTDDTFPINIGDIVSNNVPGVGAGNIESLGHRDHYTFTGTAGQILYFESLSYSEGLLDWELRSPTNESLFGTTIANDGGRLVIPTTGTYTINVFDFPNGLLTGTYSFKVWASTDDTFPINIGDIVSNNVPGVGAGNIAIPGNQDVYTFTATTGQQVIFDSLSTSNGAVGWQVFDPVSTKIFDNSTLFDSNPLTLVAGTYTIRVYSNTGATGTYSFRVAESSNTGFPIVVGDTVSNDVPSAGAGNISPAGNVDVYVFNGTAGQVVNFDVLTNNVTGSGGVLIWSLIDRTGAVVSGFSAQSFQDVNNVILPASATYSLRVQTDNALGTGTYSFKLVNVPLETFGIAIGDTISNGIPQVGAGNIETIGSQDNYTFTGTAGQVVNFDALENNVAGSSGVLIWSLVDGNGTIVPGFGAQAFLDVNNFSLPANDTYTLKVLADNGLATGTYSFLILLVGSESPQPGPTYFVNTTAILNDGVCGISDCSIIEAINAANALPNTSTITLGANQTYTLTTPYLAQSAGLPEITTPVVIQGNGSIIQRVATDAVPFRLFNVAAGARLTINSATLIGGYAEGGGAIYNSGGTMTIRSSTFSGNRSSTVGGAYAGSGALSISNSTFSANAAVTGGAIHSTGAYTITIGATTFSGNTAADGAGAIYADAGTTTDIRSGSAFTNNTAAHGSAIINNGAASKLFISGSTLSTNVSNSPAGIGAVENHAGTVTITKTTFTGNTADFGAAVYNGDGGDVSIIASTFNTNAAVQGGAIYNDANSTLTIQSDASKETHTTFTGNTANGAGGAISSVGLAVTISDAVFTGNSSLASGGAIFNDTGSIVTLTGVTLASNTAENQGGAVANLGGLISNKTTFTANSVNSDGSTGGAIYSTRSLTITDSTFTGNAADIGGAVHQNVNDATISGSTFTTNTAALNGGAVWVGGGITTSINNSTFNDNVSTGGSGAGVYINATSTVTVTNTVFKQNIANGVDNGSPQGGGAIATLGTLTVNSGNFEDNQGQSGGAVLVLSGATATINSSAFKGNQALTDGSGGGLYNHQGTVSVTNTTFANNFAPVSGGAISTDSASGLILTHVTIAGNSAAGGANSSGGLYAAQGTVDIRNSIIANNEPANCDIGAGNFNVTTSLQFPGPASCGSATVLDPQLGRLKGNPAFFSLTFGSPAIDSANSAFCPLQDQRGLLRGFDSNTIPNNPADGDCDLGAVEVYQITSGTSAPQAGTIGGGLALINLLTGQDFVQFGDTNLIPPQGTNWTGGTPALPPTGQTLGRDPSSSDTDDRTDWLTQDPTMGGQNGIKVVINEIFPGAIDAVELYNPSLETVRMEGWKLRTYNANGTLEVNYTFGEFSLAPNAYVILREGNGPSDEANLYLGSSISWEGWIAQGAVALTNGVGGVDFMRFGDSSIVVQPPTGTRWTGVNPISPLPNQSLGRDSESTDVDDGNDWFSQAPSLGLKNPLIRPAVNDDFNDAIVVLQLPFRNTQTTSGTDRANASDPTVSCGFNTGHTIWYQYTAKRDGTVRFQTDGSDYNTVLAVYLNISGSLNQIACDDDGGEGQRSRIDLNMTAGTTYYFLVGGVEYANGNVVFSGQPPANDDFDDAIVVSALPFTDSQNTTAASLPFDDPRTECSISIGRSVWYSFTATEDARVVFRTSGSDFDTVIAVYTGTRGNLVEVGCNDDSGDDLTSSYNIRTIPGTTYTIMVAGDQGAGGSLVFSADLLPRPANDFFATPTVISDPLPYRNTMDTTGATNEPLDRTTLTCNPNVGNTVWYTYTPTTDQTVIFSTSGSNFDTILAVWTDISQPSIACNDDAPAGRYSRVTLEVTAGTTYIIMVGGYNNSGGKLVLSAYTPASPPVNDEQANAVEIAPLPFSFTADVTGATGDVNDPTTTCRGIVGSTVWFHLSPTNAATQLRLQTADSDYDTVLAVYANIDGELVEIGCNDNSPYTSQSLLVTNINANTDVYVMVGDFSGLGGKLVFKASVNDINQRPANDVFGSATEISSLPYDQSQSTLNATTAPDDPVPACGASVGGSVWFRYTATSSGILRLQTAGSDYDTVLAVYTGTRGSLTEVICGDDISSTDLTSQVEFTPVIGTTYFIMVAGNGGATGSLSFHAELLTPPANDDFDSATVITLDGDNRYGTTQSTDGSTNANDDPATTCNVTTANTVWYRFTAPASGTLSLSTQGSTYNTVLAVYTGTRSSLTSIGCDDNSGANLTARLDNLSVTAGTTYSILIGGAFGQTGALTLDVALLPVPANDDFDNATEITALPYSNTQLTTGATAASDDRTACNAAPAKNVWYRYTATSADLLRLRLDDTTFNSVLAVYTGTRGNLTQVGCQIGKGFDFLTTPNTTYTIMVGGYGGASGTLNLQVSEVSLVANDDFDNAIEIIALPFTNTQSTVGASTGSDDPLTCTSSVGKSVWYRYTAAADGKLLLSLANTSFNAVLSIYTGTRGSLLPVNCALFGDVEVTVTSGSTYYIMASGFEGDSGTLVLSAELESSITASITPSTPTIESGGDVTYTVRVTNTSPVDSVTVDTLSDSLYGDLNGKGTCVIPQTIAIGEFYECAFTTPVTGIVGAAVTNTVTASGSDANDQPVSANAEATVTIGSGTPAVVANADSYSTNEDIALTAAAATGVLLNDTGSSLTASVVINPTHGTLALNADGSFIYTPNANYNGSDSFTYQASDGQGGTSNATATITINAVNDAPTAADDSYDTDEDTELNIAVSGVLGNDTDVENSTLSVTLVSTTAHGTLTLNPDGSFIYMPSANYNGADSFTYTANDGTDDSAVATVSITVNPVNDAPTAAILSPTAGNITAAANGFASVTLNSSGTTDVEDTLGQLSFLWSWTENGNPVTVTAAGTAYNFPIGTYTLTLTVTDSGTPALADTETVTFTVVSPDNQVPFVDAGAGGTITLPTNTFTVSGTATDDGIPVGSTLTTTWSGPAGVTFANPNALSTTATFAAAGSYELTLTASDGAASVSDTVTIVVNTAANTAPTITTPAAQSSNEGATVSLQVAASDPENTALTYAATGLPTGLSINPTSGLISGTLPFTAAGSYTVNLSVTDSGIPALTATTSFNWVVIDVPQTGTAVISFTLLNGDTGLPIAGYDPLLNGAVINLATLPTTRINVRANVSGTPIRSVVFGSPVGTITDNTAPYALVSGASGYPASVGTFTLSATPYAQANGTGTAGQALSITFSVINQTAPNTVPVLGDGQAVVTVNEGQTAVNTGALSDADNDPLTLTASVGSVTRSGNTWNWSYLTTDGPANSQTVTISVSDGRGGTAQKTFTLTVVNVAPTGIFTNTSGTIVAGTSATLAFTGVSDVSSADLSAPIAYRFDCTTDGTIDFNGTSTSFACSYPTAGTFTATGSIIDKDGGISTYTTTVTVSVVTTNNPPTITTPAAQSSNEGATVSLQIAASDPENTALTYAATGLPTGLSINPTSGLISGILPFTASGSYTVNLSVTDSGTPALTATTSFNWVVIDVPQTGIAVISFTLLNGDTGLPIAGYDPLLNGAVINLATLPTTRINVRANVSGTLIRSVVFGSPVGTITDNTAPYALVSGASGYPASVGTFTLSATPYAQANGTGTAGQTFSITFSVVNQAAPAAPPAALAVVPPVAAFNTDVIAGGAPLVVQFTNQSTGDNLTYAWNFGDGSTSTESNPSHTFSAAGSYTVSLTVSSTTGSATSQTSIQVSQPPPPEVTANPEG